MTARIVLEFAQAGYTSRVCPGKRKHGVWEGDDNGGALMAEPQASPVVGPGVRQTMDGITCHDCDSMAQIANCRPAKRGRKVNQSHLQGTESMAGEEIRRPSDMGFGTCLEKVAIEIGGARVVVQTLEQTSPHLRVFVNGAALPLGNNESEEMMDLQDDLRIELVFRRSASEQGRPPRPTWKELWKELPVEMQQHVLDFVPLAQLARMATLAKGMRAVYQQRLEERQACIQERLAGESWEAEVTVGLSLAHMALPRDLIDDPPVPEKHQCTPELNSQSCAVRDVYSIYQPRRGTYRGLALRGKPDGRGQWVSYDKLHTYAGDWRGGQPHGQGKATTFADGVIYRGEVSSAGLWYPGACEFI